MRRGKTKLGQPFEQRLRSRLGAKEAYKMIMAHPSDVFEEKLARGLLAAGGKDRRLILPALGIKDLPLRAIARQAKRIRGGPATAHRIQVRIAALSFQSLL